MIKSGEVVVKEPSIIRQSPFAGHGDSLSKDHPPFSEVNRHVSLQQFIPLWVYHLFVTILGTIILGSPALLIALTHDTNKYWPAHITMHFNVTLAEIFRWSVLTAGVFGTYYFTLTIITFIPFIVNAHDVFVKHEIRSTRGKDGLRRIMLIRHYLAFPLASLAMWLLIGLLIGNVPAESRLVGSSRLSEFYLTRAAFALLVFSVLLFFEKLTVQRIAINYHFDYYADRIAENQLSLAIVRKLKQKFPPTHHISGAISVKSPEELIKDEATEIALYIFNGVRSEGRDYLVKSDFERILASGDAHNFFDLLDQDSNGDITLREMIDGVQRIYSEKELLNHALAANDDLVNRLDGLGLGLVVAVTAALCLPIFNVGLAASIFYLTSTVMTAKIAFSGSMVSIFSTIIFIFVSHPFDVGDTVLIDGKKYKVKSIGWWNSSFYGEGSRLVYIANETLDNSTISNLRRSGPQSEDIIIFVHFETTRKQIEQLEDCLNEFLIKNPRDFADTLKIGVAEIVNEKNIKLKMSVKHKSNFQNSDIKNKRHLLFTECLRNAMSELRITLAEES